MLLDPGSGCASPLSIDGVAFGVGTWSTSRSSTVQVGQTVLDRYIKPGVLVPPALQLGLETDVTDPLHRVVNFFGEGMTLFEQSHFVCCIGTDGLWKSCRDGVKVIEIDSRVTLNFATNNGVIGPFNLNEVGNALVPIFGGDL